MARIRTIKPEFWDSPSTAKASPWARLLFIALWNWADDHGRGTANLKELEGFAFPHDDQFTDSSGNTVHFRDLVAEVSDCFGVLFYTVDNRPFYEIPTWNEHQRNERRAKQSKYPSPQVSTGVAEIPCNVAEIPHTSGTGTGEQGNRGTGEQLLPLEAEKKEWKPLPKHYEYGKEIGVYVKEEAEKFKKYNVEKGRELKNPNLAFTNWLKNLAPKNHPSTMSAEERADRLRNPYLYQ